MIKTKSAVPVDYNTIVFDGSCCTIDYDNEGNPAIRVLGLEPPTLPPLFSEELQQWFRDNDMQDLGDDLVVHIYGAVRKAQMVAILKDMLL